MARLGKRCPRRQPTNNAGDLDSVGGNYLIAAGQQDRMCPAQAGDRLAQQAARPEADVIEHSFVGVYNASLRTEYYDIVLNRIDYLSQVGLRSPDFVKSRR